MIKVAVIDDALAGNLIVKNIRIMSYTEVCVREMMTSKETLLVMEEKGIPNSEIFSHGGYCIIEGNMTLVDKNNVFCWLEHF